MEDKIAVEKPKPKSSFKVVTVLQQPFMMWDEETGIKKYNEVLPRKYVYSSFVATVSFARLQFFICNKAISNVSDESTDLTRC